VGQAIGDMMGLPYENMSPRAVDRRARFDRPAFLFGYGCGSDDTEHAGLTADAVVYSQGDVERFRSRLAANLRWWFLAGPPAIGLATLRACLRLCVGFPLDRAGVYSAGNGPAMRAAILGVMVPPDRLRAFVRASTRLTHTDPRAEVGSYLIAELAAVAPTIDPATGPEWIESFVREWEDYPKLEPLLQNLRLAAETLRSIRNVVGFAEPLCATRGVSGFIAHTVPVAAFAFFRHANNYAAGIEDVIRAGGDTDTVAAITGALIGSRVGMEGIPARWRVRHFDWPWTLSRLQSMRRPSFLLWPLILLRNLAFFGVVLCHALRRLLPW
jgi:ADP-ribosylglycohydrolase